MGRKQGGILNCQFCPRMFTCPSLLEIHLRKHTGDRPFVCKVCHSRFSQQSNLKAHSSRWHGNQTGNPGSTARKALTVKMEFLQRGLHASENTETRKRGKILCKKTKDFYKKSSRYNCKVCSKKFPSPSKLQRHLRTHTRGKRRTNASGLHERKFETGESAPKIQPNKIRRHKNRRPGMNQKYKKCDICSKEFSWQTKLNEHMRTHTGEKPHVCCVCDRGFARADTLKLHIMRIHTGEKPFKCERCDMRFSENWLMNSHQRRVHTGEKGIPVVGNRRKQRKVNVRDKSRESEPIGRQSTSTDASERSFDLLLRERVLNQVLSLQPPLHLFF